jgi:phage terminase large subunit GpA-like protein
MVDDVDGEGEPFDLASKRTTTFGSNAMCVAESSPSREVKDLKWIPSSPHEAPPCDGIIGLYNRGDRRRWYWPCPHCNHYFEGRFEMLKWDKREGMSNLEIAETVYMGCPKCGDPIMPDDRHEMNFWGTWLKDGEAIDNIGRVFGRPMRSMIASFWLRGVAAAFTTWKKLLIAYLDAMDAYERTQNEEALKKFYNNDLGEPYITRASMEIRLPETIKARAEKALGERVVPEGVRFLVATVDVQKNRWEVQVFGIMPGQPFDIVVIDRYSVRKSKRDDADGDKEWVRPHAYAEDWDELIEHVIEKEYPLGDASGRLMSIKMVGCDSGGKKGATTKAYEFYRKLVRENKHRRFILLKGESKPGNPRTRVSYPDSSRKDSKSGARGDIPVLMLNSNLLKDDLNGRLDCIEPGKGMYRTPAWLDDKFYAELCSEVRTDKGWEHNESVRNEAWDLSYYCIALCVSQFVRVEGIDWNNPPPWAAEWDKNDLIRKPEADKPFAAVKSFDFGALASALA